MFKKNVCFYTITKMYTDYYKKIVSVFRMSKSNVCIYIYNIIT